MSNWKIHLNKYYWLAYLPSGTAFLCAWQRKWAAAGICLMFALWLAEKSGMHIAKQLHMKEEA